MTNGIKVLTTLLALILSMGCERPNEHQLLTNYIEWIDYRIEDETVRQWIKQSKGGEVVRLFMYDGLPIRPDTSNEVVFLKHREDIVRLYDLPKRYPYQNCFFAAVHRQYLNRVPINPEAAKREAAQYESIIVAWQEQHDRETVQSKYARMRRNYEKHHIGDTIVLTFPFDTSDDSERVYYPAMLANSPRIVLPEEVLEVQGKVVRKYYRGTNSEVWADSLDHAVLQVEILESALLMFRVWGESYTVGDTLDLYLYDYGDSISSPR